MALFTRTRMQVYITLNSRYGIFSGSMDDMLQINIIYVGTKASFTKPWRAYKGSFLSFVLSVRTAGCLKRSVMLLEFSNQL